MTRKLRAVRIRVLAAVGLLLLATACSPAYSTGSRGAPVAAAATTPNITLAVNSWTGSTADVYIAKWVLETQVGTKVKTVQLDEIPVWPAMAQGRVDGVLEVWGHEDLYDTYITKQHSVVDGGPLGAVGHIGWYVPAYVIQQHPSLASWEGLETASALFKTPESGSAGQMLDGSPSYVTNDGPIIKNLGLDFKIVYAGSEAAEIAQVRQSYAQRKPLLFYFYTPQWLNSQLDLREVALPPYTAECGKLAPEKINCAYPTYNLYKAFSAHFAATNSEAYQVLRNMRLTNRDQDEISSLIADKNMSPDAAAAAWGKANPSVWMTWLPGHTQLPSTK
jgi:glycine betaine/proline transport system substrate-binding protein